MPSEISPGLFAELPATTQQNKHPKAHRHDPNAPARVLTPNRLQIELHPSNLESLLAEGHQARLVWRYVEQQNLKGLYDLIKARQGGAGRDAIAPEILLALWLYATVDHVGNARELARLTLAHDAYRWICGGVQVSYHTLSDFRIDHGAVLDEILTDNLAALMAVGVVKLKRAAQDGVRVRASAGAASFRREDKLNEHLTAAREHIQALKQQIETDPGALSRKQAAARARAAREREERVQAALNCLPEIEAIKQRQGKKAEDARASSTDGEATVMKMADGGFRPAYNIQFATDCDSQIMMGVEVVSVGSDMGQLAPMVEQVQERCECTPDEWLVDGGYSKHEQIDAVSGKTMLYAPVPEPKRTKKAKTEGDDDKPID
jgi:transposase